MDNAYKDTLFVLQKSPEEYQKLVDRFNKDWQGSCFGMSSTMTLCYLSRYYGNGSGNDLIYARDLQPGAVVYNQITPPKSNRNALNWINFFQASHCVSATLNGATAMARLTRYRAGGSTKMKFTNMNGFVNEAISSIDAGLPFVFAYGYDKSAHAVVGCDYYYDTDKNFFYLKFYDENDLGSQRKYDTKPHFCYIRLKYSGDPNTSCTYSAPYADSQGNEICNIYYYNYAKKKYLPKSIRTLTCYDVTKMYANLSGSLISHGLRQSSNNAASNLALDGVNGAAANNEPVLTIDRVNETWEEYRIKPFVYGDGDMNKILYADDLGKLYRVEIGPAIGSTEPEPEPELEDASENEAAQSTYFPPIPVALNDDTQDFVNMTGYEHVSEVDSENDGVDLAIKLKENGAVGGSNKTFDGFDLVLSDGFLPGASLAKGNKYAWVSGEGIDYVRYSSDGRLRDVFAGENGGSNLNMYFGTKEDTVNLDMFRMRMSSFDWMQVYDTEDDPSFNDCIVLCTDGLAEGFDFCFYKGALISDEYSGTFEPDEENNAIWIKIKAFSDQESGDIGVKLWALYDDPDAEYIPDFSDDTLVFTTKLHERVSAYSGRDSGYTGNFSEGSRNAYSTKGGSGATVLADGSLQYTIDAPYERHTGAAVDGIPVKEGTDCEFKSGSTVITLKPEFLATLKDGTHTLTVYFTDGSFMQSFTTPLSPSISTTTAPDVPATGGAPVWVIIGAAALGLGLVGLIFAKRNKRR